MLMHSVPVHCQFVDEMLSKKWPIFQFGVPCLPSSIVPCLPPSTPPTKLERFDLVKSAPKVDHCYFGDIVSFFCEIPSKETATPLLWSISQFKLRAYFVDVLGFKHFGLSTTPGIIKCLNFV